MSKINGKIWTSWGWSGINTWDQTDATLTFTDITTNDVSSTKHWFTPKLPNNTTTFLRGDWTYATPSWIFEIPQIKKTSDYTTVLWDAWKHIYFSYVLKKAIFWYWSTWSNVSMTNLISNTWVVATDTTWVWTARQRLAWAWYWTDKAIFWYWSASSNVSMTNLVSNTWVVATDTTWVWTARKELAWAWYWTDKAIFWYGLTTINVSMINLVSNTWVVATDTTWVWTTRYWLAWVW